jgi:hypothetical protein
MYEVKNKAGRLVELWIDSPSPIEEVRRSIEDIKRVVGSVIGKVTICSDLTRAQTFSPEGSDLYLGMMRADNPRIERSGFLLGPEAHTFTMQLERMIRDAGSPSRRAFRKTSEIEAWLGDTLIGIERIRLHEFLEERARAKR